MSPFTSVLVAVLAVLGNWPQLISGRAMDRENIDPLQLSTFQGYEYDYSLGGNGVYKFYYVLPQSERYEERTASGEVIGNYAFVAPEGDEFRFKYEADKEGFRVESNALPTPPEDTEEVKKAKEEFFEAFNKALELAELYGDEEEEEEESDESDESDESYEDSDEDDSSEEDSSEESDEDDEEEEEEEEESESKKVETTKKTSFYPKKKVDLTKSNRFRRPIYPSYKNPSNTYSQDAYGGRVNGQHFYRR